MYMRLKTYPFDVQIFNGANQAINYSVIIFDSSNESVFVDDFIRNIVGAREVGMHAIHFQTREQTLEELNELLG